MSGEFQYDVFLSHSAKEKLADFQPSAFILQPFLDAPIKGSLAQFLYINWLPADGESETADVESAEVARIARQ